MQRRDFLRLVGAATMAPATSAAGLRAAPEPGGTVLYDDRVVTLDRVRPDAKDPAALWVRRRDLPRINEFELKPQGACREEICIPVPKDMSRGEYFNLSAFAKKVSQPVVAEPGARVWSLGEMPLLRGSFLESRMAPDFGVPDRQGRVVKLSSFRGRKVLVVTWASW